MIAGHDNLIQYWLEERPDLEPRFVAAVLNRLFYAPFFIDGESATWRRPSTRGAGVGLGVVSLLAGEPAPLVTLVAAVLCKISIELVTGTVCAARVRRASRAPAAAGGQPAV